MRCKSKTNIISCKYWIVLFNFDLFLKILFWKMSLFWQFIQYWLVICYNFNIKFSLICEHVEFSFKTLYNLMYEDTFTLTKLKSWWRSLKVMKFIALNFNFSITVFFYQCSLYITNIQLLNTVMSHNDEVNKLTINE